MSTKELLTKLLQSCNGDHALQQAHLSLLKSGLLSSLHYSNRLLHLYARHGGRESPHHKLFDEMPSRNHFSYNTLVDSHLKSGRPDRAFDLFKTSPQKNTFSWNLIISGLVRADHVETARRLFDEMPDKDPVAFNCVLHGLVRRGRPVEALKLFRRVNAPSLEDRFVLATALSACARALRYGGGVQIHARIVTFGVEFDSFLGSSLVDMYCKCGDVDRAMASLATMQQKDEFSLSSLILAYAERGRLAEAISLFRCCNEPGVVLWNSLLTGFVSGGHGFEALELFRTMISTGIDPDSSSFTAITPVSDTETGKQIHCRAIQSGLIEDAAVRTSLLDLYSKAGSFDSASRIFHEALTRDEILVNAMIAACADAGRVDEARELFDSMAARTTISWNSMTVGYSKNGFPMEALELFSEIRRRGLTVDRVNLAAAISSCAGIASLRAGEQIFGLAVTVGFESDGVVATALIDFYGKCGFPSEGRVIFDGIETPDLAAWNSMLAGYAANGLGPELMGLFESMRLVGVKPNEVTFLALLSGCCHSGLVDHGQKLFLSMEEEFKVRPIAEHYACLVNLLVNAGKLDEAFKIVDPMSMEADEALLTSLLRGCQEQGDDILMNEVTERLVSIGDESRPGVYLQLSSFYARQGMWDVSLKLRRLLKQRRVIKNPGISWNDS